MSSAKQSRNDDDDDEVDLRDHQSSDSSSIDVSEIKSISARICQILFPVTLCSIYVACLVRLSAPSVNKSAANSLMARTWSRIGLIGVWPSDDDDDSALAMDHQSLGKALLGPLIIALMFVALIVIISMIMLLILYMRWHACLAYYFYLPSLLIMALISPAYLRVIARSSLSSCEWFALDLITLAILTWNFTSLGMMAIFSLYASAPLIIQQLYLIHNSAIVAVLIVNYLSGWTPWILLFILVIWDTFAVLTPFGPLNLIISMAERLGMVDMPGLIYSTDVTQSRSTSAAAAAAAKTASKSSTTEASGRTIIGRQDNNSHPANSTDCTDHLSLVEAAKGVRDEQQQQQPASPAGRKSIQERGVNIGLGDFIFYSLLVGLTVKEEPLREFYTPIATFLSILVGVVLTLIILALTRRSLPALPISIALGTTVAAISCLFCPTLADRLTSEQIFI